MTQAARFALIQLGAILLASAAVLVLRWPAIYWALCAGLLSMLAACRWQDRAWWRPIHFVFPFLLLLALQLSLDPHWYLAAFVLCWLIFGGVLQNRVPLYLSNSQALALLSEQVPEGARLLDIGAGTGTVLAWFVRHRPDVQLAGVELAWLPWLLGKLRLVRTKAGWLRGDAFTVSLAGYDVVYAYLSPEPMGLLWEKAQQEMRPGSLFISNSFDIPNVPPERVCNIGDWKGSRLLVWKI